MGNEVYMLLVGFIAGAVVCLLSFSYGKDAKEVDKPAVVNRLVLGRPDNRKARTYQTREYRESMLEYIERQRVKRNAGVS